MDKIAGAIIQPKLMRHVKRQAVDFTAQERYYQAVGHDQDSSRGKLDCILFDHGRNSLESLVKRFTPRRAGMFRFIAKGGIFLAELLQDITDQHAFPVAMVDLAQALVAMHRQGKTSRNDPGGLNGTLKVAADQ